MGRLQLRDSDSRWPGLTELERGAAEEYMKDLNQVGALRRAKTAMGDIIYNEASLASAAQSLFNRPRVRAYMKFLIEERSRVTRIDSNWVLQELQDLYMEVRRGDSQDLRLAKDTLLLIGKHVDVSAFEERIAGTLIDQTAPAAAVFVGVAAAEQEIEEGEYYETN